MGNNFTHTSVLPQSACETNVNNRTAAMSSYDQAVKHASNQINHYILERVPNFRTLMDLREKVTFVTRSSIFLRV